ncbi:Hypothetical protein LUCI_0294 [Lucifera butyrica]|uniref:Uncharacterized protein n=1 Tax=Lucifera butyrica TaxID=1351585 RepID=A0A498R7I1_9FIRM|nr:hypothetical protein [Lucifera butyrica]VBB05088.1 Hypothetical protein LUCI_0294 [Lucifera butyrica]
MDILKIGSRILGGSSPSLLVATGAVLALTFPPVRRGLRAAAVVATKGVLAVSDRVTNLSTGIRQGASGIIDEARETGPIDGVKSIRASAKTKGRRIAVATTAGALTLKKKATSIREGFKGIVNEAKEMHAARQAESLPSGEANPAEAPS